MAKLKTEVILTVNGQSAIQVLEEIRKKSVDIAEEMTRWDPKTKEYKELKQVYTALSSAQENIISSSERLDHAVQNLANTSLQNLRRALGAGKRDLESLSEAEIEQANNIRSMMKVVGDQIRLLEGRYVKIKDGIESISTQSDQWLDKAIKQQNEMLSVTRRGTQSYQEQENVLQKLTAEQKRRADAELKQAEMQKQQIFNSRVSVSKRILSSPEVMKNHSQAELQSAIGTLKQAQGMAKIGSDEWRGYSEQIERAEKNLAELAGRVEQTKRAMSKDDAKIVLDNMGDFNEQEIREAINTMKALQKQTNIGSSEWRKYTEEINKAEDDLAKLKNGAEQVEKSLSQADVNKFMASLNEQSEEGLKNILSYLEKTKASLQPFTKEWKFAADNITEVKKRLDEVQQNSPYKKNFDNALNIAKTDTLDFGNGNTHDVTSQDLKWAKGKLQQEYDVTPVVDKERIQKIKEAISLIDERMKSLSESTDDASMSSEKLDEVLGDIKTAPLKDLREASSELKKQLEELAPSSQEAEDIRDALSKVEDEIKQVEDGIVDVNDVIQRSRNGQSSIDELKQAYKQLESEVNKINTGTKEFRERNKDLKELKNKLDEVSVSAHKNSGAWSTALHNLAAYAGLFKAFNLLQDKIVGAIKKNFEFSDSLNDIRKVSGLTTDEVSKLSNELAKIDSRTSLDGLAKLAYEGSKLGMGKYGVEGLAGFVKAADQINVAIGEEMGDDALTALSKLVETMGLIPKMGIEQAMLSTGSAMFKLSSTSTATSNNIVEFSKRLTGVARTAGITTDQILALASASDSMMLMPEVASTAMSKFIVALQKNHNLIEKDLGIPEGTIKSLYAAGNAMDAIVLVLEKMRDKGNMNVLGGIFKDLGSDGQRLVTSMVTMSKNVDMLKDHLYESKEAFQEATAVTDEYKMQQQSAAGILERANNLWEKAFVNPEGVDMVKGLATAWYELSQNFLNSPWLKGSIASALQSVITLTKVFINLLPFFINFAATRGAMALLGFFINLTRQIYMVITAQKALNIAMKANIFGAIASAIMTVASLLWGYANAAREAAAAQEEANRKANKWKDTLIDAKEANENIQNKLKSYKKILSDTNLREEDRRKGIDRFNKDFRQYISNLDIEISSVSDLKKHYKELSIEIQRATYYRLREKAKENALPELQENRVASVTHLRETMEKEFGDNSGLSVIQVKEMADRGVNAVELYKKVIESLNPQFLVNKGLITNKANKIKWSGVNEHGYVEYLGTRRGDVLNADIKNTNTTAFNDIMDALRWYINSTNRVTHKTKEIDKAYAPFVPKDYTPYSEDEPGTLENDAPDKKAIAEAKRQKQEQMKEWRDELKQKQDEANAIIDNVQNFYNRQINERLEQAVASGMNETEQSLFVEPLKVRMNKALEQVRLAIAGQKNSWETFKATMQNDLIEMTDETGVNLSQNLLDSITANNVDELRKKLSSLGNNLGRSFNSVISEVFAKSTQNAQKNLSLELQQQDMRRKIAQEHDYTGVVQQNMYNDFNQMGYANPTTNEIANTDSGRAAFNARKRNIGEMFEMARKNISELYSLDMQKSFDRGILMKILFGNNARDLRERIEMTLANTTEDWQSFYLKLIQYSDEYTEAQKKAADERKKIYDFQWKKFGHQKVQDDRSAAQQRISQGTERFRLALSGKGFSSVRSGLMGGDAFMESFSYNGNIEQSKLEITLLQEKIKWLQQYGATSEQVAELQTSLAEKQDAYILSLMQTMKERADSVYALYQPLESFGEAAGAAFATMTEDAEAGRDAFQKAIGDMVNAMMKQTVQMTEEYIKRRLMQKVNDRLVSIQFKKASKEQIGLEQKGADEQTAISQAAGEAKTLITEQVGTEVLAAITKQTQESTTAEKAAAMESVQTEAAAASAEIPLGIAKGSAKTIGQLGWWGIPLIAGITAVLNGLLSFAMGKVSSVFGNNKKSDATTNTKLVTGMLTYDSGNVQDLNPYITKDGKLYWAENGTIRSDGVNIISSPMATSVNGRPSLVAENGPEIVIGRETTKAMMMNNPNLLRALVNYDKKHSAVRAFDDGNVNEVLGNISPNNGIMSDVHNSNLALMNAVSVLLRRLDQPINAKIDMYGRGNLYDSMTKANSFMKNK